MKATLPGKFPQVGKDFFSGLYWESLKPEMVKEFRLAMVGSDRNIGSLGRNGGDSLA